MSILWNFDKYAKIEELPFDPSCINSDSLYPISGVELLLRAGTPLVLAVEEEDEGGGDEAKGATKKGDTKLKHHPDLPSYTLGTVHPFATEDAPTCFAAEDYHFILTNAQQPNLVKCVTKGYVEKAKVREAVKVRGAVKDQIVEGSDLPDDWDEFLATEGLYLVDDLGNLPGGGSGSGGVHMVEATAVTPSGESSYVVLGETAEELATAIKSGEMLFIKTQAPSGQTRFGPLVGVTLPSSAKLTLVSHSYSFKFFLAENDPQFYSFTAESPEKYPYCPI